MFFFLIHRTTVFQGYSMVKVTAEKYRAPLLLYYIFFKADKKLLPERAELIKRS